MEKYQILFDLTQHFEWKIKLRQRDGISSLSKGDHRLRIDFDQRVIYASVGSLTDTERNIIRLNQFDIRE